MNYSDDVSNCDRDDAINTFNISIDSYISLSPVPILNFLLPLLLLLLLLFFHFLNSSINVCLNPALILSPYFCFKAKFNMSF